MISYVISAKDIPVSGYMLTEDMIPNMNHDEIYIVHVNGLNTLTFKLMKHCIDNGISLTLVHWRDGHQHIVSKVC